MSTAVIVDSFTIDVDPGQTITVVVDSDSSLQPTVQLTGPNGLDVIDDNSI